MFIFLFLTAAVSLFADIQGIVLLGGEREVFSKEELAEREGIWAEGMALSGKLEGRLARYLGREMETETIREIKEAISMHFREQLVLVTIPPQNVTMGVLQVRVEKPKVGRIEGENRLGLQESEELDTREVHRKLDFANRHPFRRLNLIYRAGEMPKTTDVVLLSEERRSYRVTTGVENSGVRKGEKVRLFTSLSGAWHLGWDHIVSAQYTTSEDFRQFRAIQGQYVALFPWCHELKVFGGTSDFLIEQGIFRNRGQNGQVSARYGREVTIGFDWKRMESVAEFGVVQIEDPRRVNLTQLTLGYAGKMGETLDWEMTLFWSPGEWLSDQSNAAFASLRPAAKNHWFYARGELHWLRELPWRCSLYTTVRGQVASEPLLPSEEMGLGGADSVRGYEERQVSADQAVLGSLEVRRPLFGGEGLFFVDGAYGWQKEKNLPAQQRRNGLLSTGLGLRYAWKSYLSLRLDYGFKLYRQRDLGTSLGKLHFCCTASY